MRSFHKIIFVLAILLYTSCANESGSSNMNSDTNSVARNDSATDTIIPFDTSAQPDPDTAMALLQEWQKMLRDTGISMNLKNFYRSGMKEFTLYDQGPWDGEVRDHFVSSPDSRYYSFEYSSWDDGDADTYIHLVDRIEKRQYIVDVIGTCCSYEGTGWLNDFTIVAIGYDTYEAEEKFPGKWLTQGMYSVFNLKTGEVTTYKSKNYFSRPCRCGPTSSK